MDNVYSIHLKVSRVENGQFVAESDDIPGLIAQGRTITETIEIAQDVARKLLESYAEHGDPIPPTLKPLSDTQSSGGYSRRYHECNHKAG